MPFFIIQQDITKVKADAIVNAANTELKMGGGVCGAIFKAAGATKLQAACDKLSIKTGQACVTPAYKLHAKIIIHAAGPVYQQWNKAQNEELLRAAYTHSLQLAVDNHCETIAFPLISSGIYGYPKEDALKVSVSAIQDFLSEHELHVTLTVFDKTAFTVSRKLLGHVESYIEKNYADRVLHRARRLLRTECESIDSAQEPVPGKAPIQLSEMSAPAPAGATAPLQQMMENLDESFSQMLLRLIDEKGKTDVQVYKAANMDRKLFSKLRSKTGYMPSKRTALALAIALELPLYEAELFLKRAGFALSHAVKFDVIIEYFIVSKKYDIFEINEVLFEYDQPLLG